MKALMASILAAGLLAAAHAAAPADAPAGTTGQCKDGSYVSTAERKGACRGHKGVKDWYAAADAKAAPAAKAAAAAPPKAAMPTPATTQAPGGGPGIVWANDETKVYHCQGDRWYGRTKHGEYLAESDAKAKGFHAGHGKACAAS